MEIYSLVCWGGATGKSVAVSASTDYVTLTNHGLKNGAGVRFFSGTLPTVAGTALALNTTYYAKYISSNTFELYYDAALTSNTKINFTSTGSSLVLKSAYLLGLSDTSRWGTRIYDGLNSWYAGRKDVSTYFDAEVCELGEAMYDGVTAVVISAPAESWTITSLVNGVRSSAFPDGSPHGGYVITYGTSNNVALTLSAPRCTVDGLAVFNWSTSAGTMGIRINAPSCTVEKCVVVGGFNGHTGIYVTASAAVVFVKNCLVTGFANGYYIYNTATAVTFLNCIAYRNGSGFYTNNTSGYSAQHYNCISIGNASSNWFTGSMGDYNAGESDGAGGYLLGTPPGAGVIGLTSADFVNYLGSGTAPNWTVVPDLSPSSASAGQVDAGTYIYGVSPTDITDAEVPNYNNGGAEAVDIGCYEYDHGFGNHPATATISLTNIVSGSRVLITRDDTSAVLYNDVPGASLSFVTGYIGNFSVVIRKASESPYYREFSAGGATVADQTTSIKALQQLDE